MQKICNSTPRNLQISIRKSAILLLKILNLQIYTIDIELNTPHYLYLAFIQLTK